MPKAIKQQVPFALLACFGPLINGNAIVPSSNAATLELTMTEESPTQCSPVFAGEMARPVVRSDGLTLGALSRSTLPDSRNLEDWERKDLDDFFWSHFS